MRYLIVLLLAGCATQSSGVISMSDRMVIRGKNTTIGATSGDVMADLYKQANAHCAKQGQAVQEIRVTERGAGLAQFPEGSMEFRCVPR